jgi:hypothetical protein
MVKVHVALVKHYLKKMSSITNNRAYTLGKAPLPIDMILI